MNDQKLSDAIAVLRDWAVKTECVQRVFIFGSRAKGTSRLNSDLDVGVEINLMPSDENIDATWSYESKKWRAELQNKIYWTLQLELHDPSGSTPTISKGENEGHIQVYARGT